MKFLIIIFWFRKDGWIVLVEDFLASFLAAKLMTCARYYTSLHFSHFCVSRILFNFLCFVIFANILIYKQGWTNKKDRGT